MAGKAVTIGADPEFFVMDSRTNNIVPIVGMLGGTKEAPLPVPGALKGFAIQEDNVMAEYNIPPTTDAYQFAEYVTLGRQYALTAARKANPHLTTYQGCGHLFPSKHLQTPQAQMFGCSPDFDAYAQGRALPRIQPVELEANGGAWRFAGGHVHIGYDAETFGWLPPPFVVAAFCDVFLSIPMIAHEYDCQGERRKWYGTAGRFRPTAHGIEYRTLGNSWTMRDSYCVNVAYGVTNLAAEFKKGEARIRQLYNDLPWVDIRRTINTEDYNTASELRNHFRATLGLETM